MTISEIDGRDALQPLRRRHRLSGDMAMDPFHRIGGAERQTAGQHLIERDAERVEVAARVDRAVHSPGLFRRHIGERAGDDLGRLGRLTLARQTRGDAEPGEPRPSVRAVHQDIGRLDVLVDEAALVRLAQRGGDADGEAQEASRLHRRADQPLERFAARILEQQRCSTAFADQRERPRRPCGVELVPQFIFVGEAIEDGLAAGVPRRAQRPARRRARRRSPRAILGRRRDRHPPTGPESYHRDRAVRQDGLIFGCVAGVLITFV